MDWIIGLKWKDATFFDGWRLNSKTSQTLQGKIWWWRLVHFANISTQNGTQQFVWPPHGCSISDTLGHDPNKTMHGVLGDLVPDVDQGITKLPSSLRCNLMDELEDVGPSGHSQEVCFWFVGHQCPAEGHLVGLWHCSSCSSSISAKFN